MDPETSPAQYFRANKAIFPIIDTVPSRYAAFLRSIFLR
jgi:hypothetical protein